MYVERNVQDERLDRSDSHLGSLRVRRLNADVFFQVIFAGRCSAARKAPKLHVDTALHLVSRGFVTK